jgi:hypothetical protein
MAGTKCRLIWVDFAEAAGGAGAPARIILLYLNKFFLVNGVAQALL